MTERQHPVRKRLSEGRDFEPCIVLPVQFFDATAATGEQRLLFAMLEDAVHLLRRRPGRPSRRSTCDRQEIRAARAWIAANDPTFPFSFVSVCAALGLDPAAVRRELRRAAAAAGRPTIRTPDDVSTRRAVHG